ncbi:ABC transporter ATP-binding protein [Erwinia tracheiphila]|nr:ABC transporter ATP-binding protein [Erwinia tracheiphila]UIA82528.1 ABC transporter ATP-binding protein [Erwinia tracheiphila]UIA91118.1 ABC transporter ATP-binding protein [Erwinia tracheiphila]
MIHLNNLTAGYRGKAATPVLEGRFLHGSMTALIGANGSGKSTLLKTVAGLLRPVSGSVTHNYSPGDVFFLPQQSEIERGFPVSVFDLVAMGCWRQCGWFGAMNRSVRQSVMGALEKVNMQDFALMPPGELSGGQLQRVLFARLLVQNASLLLLDEPFTGIDSETTAMLLTLLEERHQAGCTLIVVLHDLVAVEKHFSQTLKLLPNRAEWLSGSKRVTSPNVNNVVGFK